MMKKWRCMICGYVHSGDEPPEQCPVCKAPKNMFVEIDAEGNRIDAPTENTTQQTQSSPLSGSQQGAWEKFARFVLRHHLHPILAHTPNGLIPVIVVFLLLGNILHSPDLEKAAFYNMIFVILTMPAVILTGYLEWQKHYMRAKTVLFFSKISCSIIVFTSLVVLVCWQFINPEVAAPTSPARWIYFLISLIMLVGTGIAGHLGGKLVFGSREK